MGYTLADLVEHLKDVANQLDCDPPVKLINPVGVEQNLTHRNFEDAMKYNPDKFTFEIYIE